MTDFADLSRKMVSIVGLKYEPVVITLIKSGQPISSGYIETAENLRHCQSIMIARKGECLVVPANKHLCPVGSSAMGLVPLPEKVKSGEFHYNMGMYVGSEAAAKTISTRSSLPQGSAIATVLSPLGKAKFGPNVVTGIPEPVFWLLAVPKTSARVRK